MDASPAPADAQTDISERPSPRDAEASLQPGDAGSTEPMPSANCLTDSDGDGFGVEPMIACASSGPKPGDCDDRTATTNPAANELCNGIDDDCNPLTPDGTNACGSYACRSSVCLTTCAKDNDCSANLHCLNGSCVGGNDGTRCSADNECTSGACYPSGLCGPKLSLGATCNTPADCTSGSTCGQTNTCLLSVGLACSNNTECASQICYQKCISSPGHLNAGCDEKADCDLGLKCVTNLCKQISGNCTSADVCADGYCVAGQCTGYLSPPGGVCAADSDCVTGAHCSSESHQCVSN
jgi:hypothetical protein